MTHRARLTLATMVTLIWTTLASAAVPPEAAARLLQGEGNEVLHDEAGYTYRVFQIDPQSILQDLIDVISQRLMSSTIGQAICRDILGADWRHLVHHLAMSPSAATKTAAECARGQATTSLVYDDPESSPTKLTLNGINLARRYVIVVTDRPDLPLDSWTDAVSNQTTIFLHHSRAQSDLNLRYLTQTIAHETAIYFDAKYWPFNTGWNKIPRLKNLKMNAENLEAVQTAALNPAIATVLAFIRAYKIERQMVRELLGRGLLGAEPLYYPADEYPFLRLSCRAECLREFILEQQRWIDPIVLPLIAFSPQYRSRALNQIRTQSRFRRLLQDVIVDALESFPVSFLMSIRPSRVALDLAVQKTGSESDRQARLISTSVMRQTLLPGDLETLTETTIHSESQKWPVSDLLSELTIPLLSDVNTALSAGPRPRIRSGGTR